MNVIIANKQKALLESLGVDIIKEMEGEFDVDTIISTFQNFFYQRMILDITAIKNYTDISNLQKLSMSLDTEKLILLLDGTEATNNPSFLSNLVSMGIYNFTKNFEGIQYLYNTPNNYRDVAQFQQINSAPVEKTVEPVSKPKTTFNFISRPTMESKNSNFEKKIIGLKNITKQAGATSLAYMMKQELSKNYSVVAIEVDKTDFPYFRDREMISTTSNNVGSTINNYKNKDVIIIDINNSQSAEGFCHEILYLIEPSIIKLQKLMTFNPKCLDILKGKKVILNQSLLNSSDVSNFEYESKLNVFYNLVPLNDRLRSIPELRELLIKLGFDRLK